VPRAYNAGIIEFKRTRVFYQLIPGINKRGKERAGEKHSIPVMAEKSALGEGSGSSMRRKIKRNFRDREGECVSSRWWLDLRLLSLLITWAWANPEKVEKIGSHQTLKRRGQPNLRSRHDRRPLGGGKLLEGKREVCSSKHDTQEIGYHKYTLTDEVYEKQEKQKLNRRGEGVRTNQGEHKRGANNVVR